MRATPRRPDATPRGWAAAGARRLGPLLLALAIAVSGCGGGDGEPTGGEPLEVTSEDLVEGASIPPAFTCDAPDGSPQLSWTPPPAGTAQLVVIVDDPDAPGRWPFVHWTVWDLEPERLELPRGAAPASATEGTNDRGTVGYAGPCPPEGDGPHTYRFRVLAVGEDLALPAGAAPEDVLDAVQDDVRASGTLSATFER